MAANLKEINYVMEQSSEAAANLSTLYVMTIYRSSDSVSFPWGNKRASVTNLFVYNK
jgi:hypothetical protein